MKRILHLLVLLIIALCFMPAAYAESPVDRPVNTSSLDDIFASRGVNGTIVIYDVQKNGYWLHNAGRAAERFYPASTFKIFNSLIGLSEGVIKDADEVFYRYGREPVYLESWKADASLRSAIKLPPIKNWRAASVRNACRPTLKSCTTATKALAVKSTASGWKGRLKSARWSR